MEWRETWFLAPFSTKSFEFSNGNSNARFKQSIHLTLINKTFRYQLVIKLVWIVSHFRLVAAQLGHNFSAGSLKFFAQTLRANI